MPMYIDGKWKYDNGAGRKMDRAKVEDFKTRFFKFEGYNPGNGYPMRETLEKMNLKKVADMFEKQRQARLGKSEICTMNCGSAWITTARHYSHRFDDHPRRSAMSNSFS